MPKTLFFLVILNIWGPDIYGGGEEFLCHLWLRLGPHEHDLLQITYLRQLGEDIKL